MGLDQYAFVRGDEDVVEPRFAWRKHSKLQTFMEDLFAARTGQGIAELNCGALELDEADIDALETAVKEGSLPHCDGGFFYGHQFQGEAAAGYRDYDLEFCAWARDRIAAGQTVIYSCWW